MKYGQNGGYTMWERKILYTVLFAIFFFINIFFIEYQPFVILLVMIILPIILFIYTRVAENAIETTIELDDTTVVRGDSTVFHLKIRNESFMPIAGIVVQVKFSYSNCEDSQMQEFELCAKEFDVTELTAAIQLHYCGKLNVSIHKIYLYDIIKLFRGQLNSYESISLTVLPQLIEPEYSELHKVDHEVCMAMQYSENKSGNDSSEVFDVREYREGDNMNTIHWKLSARADGIFVKEFGLPISNSDTIVVELLECHTDMEREQLDGIYELLYAIGYLECLRENACKLVVYSSKDEELKSIEIWNREMLIEGIEMILQEETYENEIALQQYTSSYERQDGKIYYIRTGKSDEMFECLDSVVQLPITVFSMNGGAVQGEFYRENNVKCIWVDCNNIREGIRAVE